MDERTWDRFWSKVSIGSRGCWEWQACRAPTGYGKFGVGSESLYAHRVSFAMTQGDPGPLFVLHRCDNPACVRPSHLFAGTHAENMGDMLAKGRGDDRRGERHPGHKLTADDVREIRSRYAAGGISQRRLGAEYGVGDRAVSYIVNRHTWSHLE